MTPKSHPPTHPEECLTQSRASRYKGGTIIAEDVWTIDEHKQRLCDPDRYRPEQCRGCGNDTLHVHDYPERKPIGERAVPVLKLVRFICTVCSATWRVLPAFLPRHLWWTWRRVEDACSDGALESEVTSSDTATSVQTRAVPPSTRRRWVSRMMSSARQLVVLLVSRGTQAVRAVGLRIGADVSRGALVASYAAVLGPDAGTVCASVAALVDRLERGIRLM